MNYLNLIVIAIIFIPMVVGEGAPPPPPCKNNDEKKDCFGDITCAWCSDGNKCVDWNPCTNSSDDCPKNSMVTSDDHAKSRKNKCDMDTAIGWIIVILMLGAFLCCLIACLIGIGELLRKYCCPNCSLNCSLRSMFKSKRQNYTQLPERQVQSA